MAETDIQRRWRWEKEFLDADIKLPDGYQKVILWAVCSAIAPKGRNGIGLFVSDGFIARQLQLGHRETVSKYRHLAIELGWLTLTGKNHNRVKEVSISFPDEACNPPVNEPVAASVGEVFQPEPVEPEPYKSPVIPERTEDPWSDNPWD